MAASSLGSAVPSEAVVKSFDADYGVSLREAALGLDEQLEVRSERDDVLASVGLFATFYVSAGHLRETRERLVSAFERYREEAMPHLAWGGDPKTAKARRLQGPGAAILDVRAWMPRVRDFDDFQPAFQSGAKSGDAGRYYFIALARCNIPGTILSSVSFGLPLSWGAGNPAGSFMSLVMDIAGTLQPAHGYAGLGVHLPLTEYGGGLSMRPAVAMAERFRGLELEFSWRHSRELTEANAIKSINWLTVLSDEWVQKVGGIDQLTLDLGSGVIIHRYTGGVMIQAGAAPLLGDVQRAEPMETYERVACVLKPIRATKLKALAEHYGFDTDRTLRWLQRFDQPVDSPRPEPRQDPWHSISRLA